VVAVGPSFATLRAQVQRLLLVAAVVLLAFQVSGISSCLVPTACAETCEDDADGACSPTCNCCTCCFHPRSYARRETARALTPSPTADVFDTYLTQLPPSPPPRGIFRVPKSARV
jgi:hypothetical protein